MRKMVAISVEGNPAQVHAYSNLADYMTLCGLDGGLTGADQNEVGIPIGAKIDCPQCFAIFMEARRFRRGDFDA